MRSFSYYLVDQIYDDKGAKYNTSSRLRYDGPVRCNSIGMVFINERFSSKAVRLDYYCFYMIEGSLSTKVNGKSVEINAGDFVIFPPNELYEYENPLNTPIAYYLIHFSGTDVERFLKSIGFDTLPILAHAGLLDGVREEFSHAFDEFLNYGPYIQESVSISVQKILLMLAESQRSKNPSDRLANSLTFINTHYDRQISVVSLAQLEKMSESRYYSAFKQFTGKTPIEYITELRIKRACTLLTNSPMKILKIGETVGYTDNHFFSKQFKKETGLSPSEYRKRYTKSHLKD